MNERDLHLLKLNQLKGKSEQNTHSLLRALIRETEQVSRELVSLAQLSKMKEEEGNDDEAKEEKKEEKKKKGKTEKDSLKEQLEEAEAELQFLEDTYPELPLEQQKLHLRQLRTKYNAGKKANPVHIKKKIREEIEAKKKRLTRVR